MSATTDQILNQAVEQMQQLDMSPSGAANRETSSANAGTSKTNNSVGNVASQGPSKKNSAAGLKTVKSATSSPSITANGGKQTNGGSPNKVAVKKSTLAPASTTPSGKGQSANASARPVSRRQSAPPPRDSSSAVSGIGDGVTPENKKLPMNKIKVGSAPSPNIKEAKSKIGSFPATPRTSQGGAVKIEQNKLSWKAESKIGSLANVTYKPGGGDIKIPTKKVEVKGVSSKVGSLQNVKYKPGSSGKKIFDDKEYMKKSNASSTAHSQHGSTSQSPIPTPVGQSTPSSAALMSPREQV